MQYRTKPDETEGMPRGIPHIIGNEAAERFSFYGMKAILAVFLSQYLFLMDGAGGKPMDEARATGLVHLFNAAFYITPIIGAILADVFFGKYKVIIGLSIVYCAGHAALAMMGHFGHSEYWMIGGLVMIALGAGGIKPCVSAHVGDQFGSLNSRLLPRIFNWFYFSINLGAFASTLLTPWLLEWYGPHWAFGVPGVLMAIATFIFWLGRKRFAHVPPGGMGFLTEAFNREGLYAMLKLAPVYLFVAMFWALFDQTGSTWIFQSQDMDRNFLGFQWLPSQIHGGSRPNIAWQIAAFGLLTAAEILVSIVALEFAYTQAPRKMKSFIMCFYLAAVAVGNIFVWGVNQYIQIPSAAQEQLTEHIGSLPEDWQGDPRTVVLPGYDKSDVDGAYIYRLGKDAKVPLEVPSQKVLNRAAQTIISHAEKAGSFPREKTGSELIAGMKDQWGRQIRYITMNSTTVRIWSAGGDGKWNTKWDVGVIISKAEPEPVKKASWFDKLRPEEPWLVKRKAERGITKSENGAGEAFKQTTFAGGQVRLQGAAYFWFFSALMGVTAILFIPFAMIYRPKNYLQDS